VYQYYLPVAMWILGELEQHRKSGNGHPLTVGISAPQGCGKSTIVECLATAFDALGLGSVAVSVDDFYLGRAAQEAVAAAHPGNPLLELRGNAGTHDLQLGTDTLRALKSMDGSSAKPARVPRYNKSAFGGLGDRCPRDDWPEVSGKLDVVLLEGWMLGFRPVGPEAAAAVSPDLVPVDRSLEAYAGAWDALVDSWVVVQVGDPAWVFEWRLQAEHQMRAAGRAGMSDGQVRDFCERFQPAYRCYLPGLYADGPTTARPGHALELRIARDRTLLPADGVSA
jgi:D-glycerate 3-kinase